MKSLAFIFTCFILCSFSKTGEHKPLEIGASAPDFNLKGTDGKIYSLSSFSKAKILVIVFTCNHCPTAQAYEERLKKMVNDYESKSVQIVAISPNDPLSIRLDELGYSDLGDTYEEMQERAKDHQFNFPYLYDGETQETSLKYGPAATPHVFIFDEKRILRYSGRIDDVEKPTKTPKSQDTRDAIDALLSGKEVAKPTTKTFGCSVKWAEKKVLGIQEKEEWAKEPVTLESIDDEGVKKLLKNETDKLRLINIWATWCGPCVNELPDFLNANRMYRRRDFELVTFSTDKPDKKDRVLKTLTKIQASSKNYIYNSDDIYKLIELIDPKWQGALPYTLLIEPGGKVVYNQQGSISSKELKKLIVEHPMIGRVY